MAYGIAFALAYGPMHTCRLRKLRRSRGRCPGCAYDLTGNVSGVCPECGQAR